MQIEQPFELVIFGGLGRLWRCASCLPALYLLDMDQRLPEGRILALGRTELEPEAFQQAS